MSEDGEHGQGVIKAAWTLIPSFLFTVLKVPVVTKRGTHVFISFRTIGMISSA